MRCGKSEPGNNGVLSVAENEALEAEDAARYISAS